MPPSFPITKAFQWDLARQVERLDFLLEWLPRYADWGYQELYLHLEDAVEYPSLPGAARPDAFGYAQFGRLVRAATAAGIRVVPIVNLLGHTQYLIKVPELRELNELRDASGGPLAQGQICPLHPRTLEVARRLLRDVAPFCTAGKVHVGLDESFHLGRCPRCRAEIRRAGLAPHFAAHIDRLHALTSSLGLRLGLWGDMLALLPAVIPRLPRDVIVHDWYYYPFPRLPRVELRNFAEVNLAAPLQARGIEYWGCPMNGAFRHEPLPVFGERLANIVSWWRRCRRVNAGGFLVTSWEANRVALELPMAIDAAAACLWLEPGVDDPVEMLARGFARVFGNGQVGRPVPRPPRRVGDNAPHPFVFHDWARAALAGDAHAFCGYYRWQINERWDVCATREGVGPYLRELRALEALSKDLHAGGPTPGAGSKEQGAGITPPLLPAPCSFLPTLSPVSRLRRAHGDPGRLPIIYPPALAASLAFRRYLAQRDVFVRRAAQAVFQIRRMMVEPAVPGLRRLGEGGPAGFQRTDALEVPSSPPGTAGSTCLPGALQLLEKLRREAAAFARALRAGRAAARAMWNRSRDPRRRGPNELMVERDAERLRGWRRWLQRARSHPDLIWGTTPVCGAWQLQLTVHNFAPALQKLVIEQQGPAGRWSTLYGLPLIEFRAFAARPRAKITRKFSVPIVAGRGEAGTGVTDPGYITFRIAIRGVGQVAVSDIELTDGVSRLRPRGWPAARKKHLGRPAPQRKFPAVDWTKNQDSNRLTFRPSRNSSQGKQSTSSRFRRSLPR